MKNKKRISTLLICVLVVSCILGLVSCAKNNEFTVTWKNHNGEILEVDTKVKKGSMPTYDGAIPTKQGDDQYSYVFAGWDREISEVIEDTTYTATFTVCANKYTVIWKNYNGDILETDIEVAYGTMPSYDGDAPKKEGTGDISYVFSGWTPSVDKVTGDVTYTAKFIERNNSDLIAGVDPIISDDGKTIRYGFYPQTRVNDETLIAELNKLTATDINGWYLYNGEYYTKETAKVYNNEDYTFDDKTPIVNGNEYWFKCETIEWQILGDTCGTYYLLSSKLLDAYWFYSNDANITVDNTTVYVNNYEQSDVRKWLNDTFFNTAFALNSAYVQETAVDNNAITTDSVNNLYACANTLDKVYLPSYKDYLNADYGFDTKAEEKSITRACKTTDYARAKGAWYNTEEDLKYNGSYWTRSPSSEYYYSVWSVNSGGYLSNYAVYGDSHCVRPCISLTFQKADK